jgi:hypothetical protein
MIPASHYPHRKAMMLLLAYRGAEPYEFLTKLEF